MAELSTLVAAAQHGQLEAFGEVVSRFQPMAYAVAYGMLGDAQLAEDAAQEAFIEAYFTLANLRDPAAFPGWFRRIVLKQGDRSIRGKRPRFVPLEAVAELPAAEPAPEAAAETHEVQWLVRRTVAALPEHERIVVILFYLSGYDQAAIAAFLEIPETTVKKRLHDARRRLRARLPADARDYLHPHLPARDVRFSRRVQFFIALRTSNLPRVAALLAQDAALANVREAPEDVDTLAGGRYYLPVGGGYTPLHWAATNGDLPLLRLLLAHGADLAARDNGGSTPLHLAALHKHGDAVTLLLKHGAAVDAMTHQGLTPLHQAALRGNRSMMTLLLDGGAGIAVPDREGRTPLHWAAIQGHQAGIALLLRYGADARVRDNGGATSAARAESRGHAALAAVLLATGRTQSTGCDSL